MTVSQLADVVLMLRSFTSSLHGLTKFFRDQGCTENEVRSYVGSVNALALAAGFDPILDENVCLGLLED